MRKVTSITIHTTAEGKRISTTFSEIDESGKILNDNTRINRVVVNEDALAHIAALEEFAQGIVDEA